MDQSNQSIKSLKISESRQFGVAFATHEKANRQNWYKINNKPPLNIVARNLSPLINQYVPIIIISSEEIDDYVNKKEKVNDIINNCPAQIIFIYKSKFVRGEEED